MSLILILPFIGAFVLVGCYGAAPRGWAGPVVQDGLLYLGTKGGSVLRYDLSGQDRGWVSPLQRKPTGGGLGCGLGCTGTASVAIYGSTAVTEDKVYVATYDGRLFALYADTGGVAWQYPLGEEEELGAIVGGPKVVPHLGLLLVGSSDGNLYAFDAERRGPPRWSYHTKDKIWSIPVVVGDMAYVSSLDGNVYALSITRESPTLVQTYSAQGAIAAPPLVTEDTLYVGSFDRKFYAFDLETAQVKGAFEAQGGYWSQPLLYGDTIYVGSLDGMVYALKVEDVTQGEVIVETGGPIRADPVLAEGRMAFASRDGGVYIVDPASKKVDTVDLGSPVLSSLGTWDGRVYAHAENGSLYEVDVAAKSWRVLYSSEE